MPIKMSSQFSNLTLGMVINMDLNSLRKKLQPDHRTSRESVDLLAMAGVILVAKKATMK